MGLRWLLSRHVLLHPATLWLMMLIYVPGTVYGYYWYKISFICMAFESVMAAAFCSGQPDRFAVFALAVLWLWIAPELSRLRWLNGLRGVVEALGVVTSVKYGVWATAIIFAGQAQGDVLRWDHWMLIVGHSAMAVTALLYARFFTYGGIALLAAAAWTFLNDTIDYTFDVFPYLPEQLYDDLFYVGLFTFLLTALSVIAAALAKFPFVRGSADKPF